MSVDKFYEARCVEYSSAFINIAPYLINSIDYCGHNIEVFLIYVKILYSNDIYIT